MSCEPVLSVRNVGKAYRLYARPEDRLKHMLLRRWGREYGRAFWAIRGVSFNLCRGEMLAVIGRNGSGKSTLLQMIAGTLQPTEGDIEVRGQVAALLELGSGFNPDFTGRENVYINGAILGLSQEEMEDKIDDIIAFADIGEFIDQPVKYYSSGMFMRLAFAVTTGLSPDVLLVDEALAVGDVFFKQKCYHRLEQLLSQGTAVVLVTHNMADVEMFATQALLLHQGRVYYHGKPSEAVRRYFFLEQQEREAQMAAFLSSYQEDVAPRCSLGEEKRPEWPHLRPVPLEEQITNGKARCVGVLIADEQGKPKQVFHQGEVMHVYYEFEVLEDMLLPIGGIGIRNARNVFVHGKTALETETHPPRMVRKGRRLRYHQEVKLDVEAGEYSIEIGISEILPEVYERRAYLPYSELHQALVRLCHVPRAGQFMVVWRMRGKPSVLTHHGLCDLYGQLELQVLPGSGEE